MANLKNTLFRHKLIITIGLALTLGLVIRLLTPTPPPQSPLPPPSPLATYQNVILGSTRLDQFIAQHGQPLPDSSPYVATISPTIHYFPSVIDHLPTEITTNLDSTIQLIKEQYTPSRSHGNIKEYYDFYGPPDLELFGPWSRSGYTSYVWLDHGLIIIANPRLEIDNITEIWRTAPLTEAEFFQRFSDQFSASEPEYPQDR